MDLKKDRDLTNEKKYKKFKSQFELVNHAIEIAEHMIGSGRESSGNQNVTLDIIAEIETNPDRLAQLVAERESQRVLRSQEASNAEMQNDIHEKIKASADKMRSKK
jgi:DNA-directed RNA polymerase subunit omega